MIKVMITMMTMKKMKMVKVRMIKMKIDGQGKDDQYEDRWSR